MNIRASELNIFSKDDKWQFAGKKELRKTLPSTGNPQVDSLLGIMKEQNNKDTKAESIMNKFRSGKKLSPDELSYLAASNPEYYKEVVKVMQEREALERQMKAAKTKEQVANVYMNALNAASVKAENGASAEEITAELNQLSNAKQEYVQSAEYRHKPDRTLEENDIRKKVQEKEREDEKTEKEVEKKLEEKKEFLENIRDKAKEEDNKKDTEDVKEHIKDIQEEAEEKKKKRAKGKKGTRNRAVSADFAELQKRILEQQTFRQKVRDLKDTNKTKPSKGKSVETDAVVEVSSESVEGTAMENTANPTTAISTAKPATEGIVNVKV